MIHGYSTDNNVEGRGLIRFYLPEESRLSIYDLFNDISSISH
jgi:hypothetical protein